LYIVDLTTEVLTRVPIASDEAIESDWSPDGSTIVYATGSFIIRSYNLTTAQDRPLRPDPAVMADTVYHGHEPIWNRDGTRIAFIEGTFGGDNIASCNPDGSGYQLLAGHHYLTSYSWLHWYARASHGMDGLMFYNSTHPYAGTYFVKSGGSAVTRPLYVLGPMDTFSPDGERVIKPDIDPASSLGLLFVELVDDVTGASKRQLTFWAPPATALSTASPPR
jgi:hypothetical protein